MYRYVNGAASVTRIRAGFSEFSKVGTGSGGAGVSTHFLEHRGRGQYYDSGGFGLELVRVAG